MMFRTLKRISRALCYLLLRTVPAREPWERIPCEVPLQMFGKGARKDFSWYFEGVSGVTVTTVEEMQRWLLECRYARDPELFLESDFWQHPCTFETLRMGDCEDFALWAWRKLVELRYDAELVAGHLYTSDQALVGHTWVIFGQNGNRYVFDPVIRDSRRMIRPLDQVMHLYAPEVSVDGDLRRYAYGAYVRRKRARVRKDRLISRAGSAEPARARIPRPVFAED